MTIYAHKVEAAIKKDFENAVSGESVNAAITEADIEKGDKPVVRYDGYSSDCILQVICLL